MSYARWRTAEEALAWTVAGNPLTGGMLVKSASTTSRE
jgi:hypothetical protein